MGWKVVFAPRARTRLEEIVLVDGHSETVKIC